MWLIDGNALKLDYEKSARNNNHIKEEASAVHMQEHLHILHILDKQPTIDAVPVIRCKNCKHRRDDEDYASGHYCVKRPSNGGYFCEDTDFCSYGEPKEERKE